MQLVCVSAINGGFGDLLYFHLIALICILNVALLPSVIWHIRFCRRGVVVLFLFCVISSVPFDECSKVLAFCCVNIRSCCYFARSLCIFFCIATCVCLSFLLPLLLAVALFGFPSCNCRGLCIKAILNSIVKGGHCLFLFVFMWWRFMFCKICMPALLSFVLLALFVFLSLMWPSMFCHFPHQTCFLSQCIFASVLLLCTLMYGLLFLCFWLFH